MKRVSIKPRPKWNERLEEIGFSFHSVGGVYWNESACYEFTADEIDHIESVTETLHDMCLKAVDYVIYKNLFSHLGIKESVESLVRTSWEKKDRSVYGRFDLCYDGKNEPRLLEYNADTPTSLLEASIAQWVWLQDVFPGYDQFNSIHEKLIEAFKEVKRDLIFDDSLYFTCLKNHEEDFITTEYMRDVALQCGLDARHIFIEDIGYAAETGKFYDSGEREINILFKLYPWEWLLSDFERGLDGEKIRLIEPAWKIILSNKGILPILWEMYPDHPNLLSCHYDPSKLKTEYIRKPLLSREGANISLVDKIKGVLEISEGTYGREGFVYQEAKLPPCFDDNYPVIGSWIVNGQPAGIGIREDNTPITKNTSRFVPHYFR